MSRYESEEEFVDRIEDCLKNNSYNTWREVIPDGCKDWDRPYRVDLIFRGEDTNGLIGVEAKNTNTLGQGGIISDAIDQIKEQYTNKTYLKGNMVNRWCIAVPVEESDNRLNCFLRNFVKKRYDISLLEYRMPREYYKAKIVIDRMKKDSIHIGGTNTYPNKNDI